MESGDREMTRQELIDKIRAQQEEIAAHTAAGKSLYDASQQLIAERDALKQRCEGYQASRDWAIDRLAGCLGVEADKVRAVEYYADQVVMTCDALRESVATEITHCKFLREDNDSMRIENDALRKHLQSATERRTGFNPDADAARAKEQKC